jgi:hypothetical protein
MEDPLETVFVVRLEAFPEQKLDNAGRNEEIGLETPGADIESGP